LITKDPQSEFKEAVKSQKLENVEVGQSSLSISSLLSCFPAFIHSFLLSCLGDWGIQIEKELSSF